MLARDTLSQRRAQREFGNVGQIGRCHLHNSLSLSALVAILVFCSLALQHIVLTNRRYQHILTDRHMYTHAHTYYYSAAPKLMQQVFAVVLFFAFFVVFDTRFCFGYVQFLSCLLIVKVAQALFNSSRNTFVAFFCLLLYN